jgi:hypothetical protein
VKVISPNLEKLHTSGGLQCHSYGIDPENTLLLNAADREKRFLDIPKSSLTGSYRRQKPWGTSQLIDIGPVSAGIDEGTGYSTESQLHYTM